MEVLQMDKKELAYAKQTVFAVKDWDGFQEVMRYLARLLRYQQKN